jgi:hypothetical protein
LQLQVLRSKVRKFPANSLFFCKVCEFWAEIDDSGGPRKKFPANFPAIFEKQGISATELEIAAGLLRAERGQYNG